jgi:hypothetical protein
VEAAAAHGTARARKAGWESLAIEPQEEIPLENQELLNY